MVLGAPLVSLRGFATTRPPLLVFTLCVTAFALTTLWLAYFVRTEKQLQNIDAHSNWKSFLDHLAMQELCIQSTGDTNIKADTQHLVVNNETIDWMNVSVNTLATLTLHQVPSNVTMVQGYISSSGWKSVCSTANPFQDVQIGVSLDLGRNIPNNSDGHDLCVTLTGPRSLLPMSDSPTPCTVPNVKNQMNVALLTSRLSPPGLGERVDPWCIDGSTARLSYKINPENSVVLSISDRSIINLHLVHTSYFLFVMAVTLICYAVIRGRPKTKSLILDKVPLDP